jgi:hypothetical protein
MNTTKPDHPTKAKKRKKKKKDEAKEEVKGPVRTGAATGSGRTLPLDPKFAGARTHVCALSRPVSELPDMLEAVAAQIREVGADKVLTVSVAIEAVDAATIAVYYDGRDYWAGRRARAKG